MYRDDKDIAEGFIDTLYRLEILSRHEMLGAFFDVMCRFMQRENKALFDEE